MPTTPKKTPRKQQKKVGGPFLSVAVFCETIMEDAGGKVSAIGILDGCTFYITHDAPATVPSEKQPANSIQHLLIGFKTGDSPGKHQLRLEMENPDGTRKTINEKEIELPKAQNGGVNLRIQVGMSAYLAGIYWLDVFLDENLTTRMPLNIQFQKLPPPLSGKK
jgi:hypothetical protein